MALGHSQRAQPVEVRIDRLVLRGVDRSVAAELGPAIEAELGRLIAAHGMPATWSTGASIGQVDGGSYRGTAGSSESATGPVARQVARAIYGGGRR